MTNKPLWLLAASAAAGIGLVALLIERPDPPASRVSAPDLPIDTGAPNEFEGTTGDEVHVQATPASTAEPVTVDADRRFGEAVVFTVGQVCDDDGHCSYRPAPDHEYARYTRQQLETIAGFDGAAAIILANRIGASDLEADLEAAKRWAVQGFLLTGDPYAFHMASVYSGVQVGAQFDADGELDRSAAEEAYIWLKIGHELGVADRSKVDAQARILTDYQVFEPERLDAEVDARIEEFIADRVRLTGRTF
jgi:hypothetical protein